jgi:hypothetical protein
MRTTRLSETDQERAVRRAKSFIGSSIIAYTFFSPRKRKKHIELRNEFFSVHHIPFNEYESIPLLIQVAKNFKCFLGYGSVEI